MQAVDDYEDVVEGIPACEWKVAQGCLCFFHFKFN